MKLLSFLQQLYSLDTLDTRLTTSSRNTSREGNPGTRSQVDQAQLLKNKDSHTIANGNTGQAARRSENATPSRWGTLEFAVYFLVILVALPLMFKSVYDVSTRRSTMLERIASKQDFGLSRKTEAYW